MKVLGWAFLRGLAAGLFAPPAPRPVRRRHRRARPALRLVPAPAPAGPPLPPETDEEREEQALFQRYWAEAEVVFRRGPHGALELDLRPRGFV